MDKIDFDTLTLETNRPNDVYRNMLLRTVEADPALTKITVLPNWTYDFLRPPQGYVAEFVADAPFKADLFFTDMFACTTLTRINDVNESTLSSCVEKVRAATPKVSHQCALFERSDTQQWFPSIGDRDACIGLYSADETNARTQMSEKKWFVVSKVNMDAECYKQFERYLVKCETEGKTYRQVFESNDVIDQFKALITRNRRRLVYDFATSIGATVRGRRYTKGQTQFQIASFELETHSNYVNFVGERMFFYSDCTSTDHVQHGLLVTRAPLQAPFVYVGPSARKTTSLFAGNKWANAHSNVFPTSFGKEVNASTWKRFAKIGISKQQLHEKLVIDGELEDSDTLLRHYPYRDRTPAFRKIEETLGYTFGNVRQLQPNLVRIV